jgi:protoheme IX farnesyltransferase
MSLIKNYYNLTKPGIIRGNLITAGAGFLLASNGKIDIRLMIFTLIGITLVLASGCVFNNYLDRNIDAKMDRTKNRSIVTGEVSVRNAIIFASILGIIGLAILLAFTNYITFVLGLIGLIFYIVIYGYFKRKSVYGTLVGSISGSIPPVAGYTAVSSQLDLGALLLFLILACWQMPHFYAIAIYKRKDYKAASIPVLSVVKGIEVTKKHITSYIFLFIFVSLMLFVANYVGYTYLIVMFIVGLWWLLVAIKGFNSSSNNDIKWAHSVFGVSLIVLLVFSILISLNSILP